MMNRVCVTGSNGMLGRHFCDELTSLGIACVPLDRSIWDLAEWKSFDELDRIIGFCDVVVHCGAQLPRREATEQRTFDINVRSCLNLAEWACSRKVAFVLISGAIVYRYPFKLKIPECDEKVVNGLGGFYGYSKLLAEKVVQYFHHDGLQLLIIRPSSIYGYGQANDKLIPRFLSTLENGGELLLNQANSMINFVHAIDVVRATLKALVNRCFGTYNIGGFNCSISDVANMAAELTSAGSVRTDNGYSKPDETIKFDIDFSLAARSFGYEPEFDLRRGMRIVYEGRTREL